jgi:hypothetical protein
MREHVVYRHGRNEAEGSASELWNIERAKEKRPVLRVEADGPEEACRLAARSVSVEAG